MERKERLLERSGPNLSDKCIRIELIDGNTIEWTAGTFDDYYYYKDLFFVKNNNQIIGIYNVNHVIGITVSNVI